MKKFKSHGSGKFRHSDFRKIGKNVIFEKGVMVFHPENIIIGDNVYIGHNTILKGYYKNEMTIGDDTWIGQNCFFHSAGGLIIGNSVGIGPMVTILTSSHQPDHGNMNVMENPLVFKKVVIGNGSDIGAGSIILPGVFIGEGSIVGAGSVITKNIESMSVSSGVPAKFKRRRKLMNNDKTG